MDSKVFFSKIREIIREEIDYALNKQMNENKKSEKDILLQGLKMIKESEKPKKVQKKQDYSNMNSIKDILNQTINYAKNTGILYTEPIKFINSAQSIVSKELILKNPIEFYERVKNTLSKTEKINQTNYFVEYLWPTILNFNDELVISDKNC